MIASAHKVTIKLMNGIQLFSQHTMYFFLLASIQLGIFYFIIHR